MIRLVDVSKKYGAKVGVESLFLDVEKGSIVTLLGPSGCGKTTTLRLIAGLERPDRGEIYLDGKLASTHQRLVAPHKRNIGMVFQDLALWPHLTVRGNITFPLEGMKIPARVKGKKVDEVLRMVNLHSQGKNYPSELSGGEQQRVALARALILKPQILLFDEPLANLDLLLKKEIIATILELHREFKFSLIYVTHNQDEEFRLSNKIILMRDGIIEQEGTITELKNHPRSEFVRRFIHVE